MGKFIICTRCGHRTLDNRRHRFGRSNQCDAFQAEAHIDRLQSQLRARGWRPAAPHTRMLRNIPSVQLRDVINTYSFETESVVLKHTGVGSPFSDKWHKVTKVNYDTSPWVEAWVKQLAASRMTLNMRRSLITLLTESDHAWDLFFDSDFHNITKASHKFGGPRAVEYLIKQQSWWQEWAKARTERAKAQQEWEIAKAVEESRRSK